MTSQEFIQTDANMQKKRKRSRETTEEESVPRKSRNIDKDIQDHGAVSTLQETQEEDKQVVSTNPIMQKKEKGQAKQLKSERRSKKSKGVLANKEKKNEKSSNRKSKYTAQELKSQKGDALQSQPMAINTAIPTQAAKEVLEIFPKKEPQPKQKSARPPRFICFVGNLPFDITQSDIESHFEKLRPFEVRHRLNKATGRSKGFAFLEFESYDKMKSCLKLYHHSLINVKARAAKGGKRLDHQSKEKSESQGRRINIELTAGGGGGKSQGRRDKIKAKNQKLDEERTKSWSKEKAARDEIAATGVPEKGSVKELEESTKNTNIHPSRLTRVRQ